MSGQAEEWLTERVWSAERYWTAQGHWEETAEERGREMWEGKMKGRMKGDGKGWERDSEHTMVSAVCLKSEPEITTCSPGINSSIKMSGQS